jgi:membrane protein DedA with SNARE-associated domain
MRGLAVFIVFCVIFLTSSLVILSPLFPGNIVCFLLGISNSSHISVLSAIVNGVFYGSIVWIVFTLSFKWVEKSLSKNKIVKNQKK